MVHEMAHLSPGEANLAHRCVLFVTWFKCLVLATRKIDVICNGYVARHAGQCAQYTRRSKPCNASNNSSTLRNSLDKYIFYVMKINRYSIVPCWFRMCDSQVQARIPGHRHPTSVNCYQCRADDLQ